MAQTRLDPKHIAELQEAMHRAANAAPADWDAWLARYDQPARLELAGGEIMNPGIEGFVFAWRMTGRAKPAALTLTDRLNAQGLEGKLVIQTSLVLALLVWAELPPYRCQIFTEATHE